MANQIKKKFIGADQVGANQLLIEKNNAVRGIDSTDTEVNLIKLNTSDEVLLKGIKILDVNGLVPAAVLPSYVDDVLEYANLAAFPATGETGKIYVALDTNKCYRWSGSAYVYITSGAVDSVNGQTGLVVLDTDDVSEGATNLYFTDARAKAAAVFDGITDGVTDVAPSMDAVFDEFAAVDGRLDALETALAPTWNKVKFDLTATDITNGYIDLAHEAIANSIVAFVDRLAIHQAEDFTLSVVGGVTRITFAGDLIAPGVSSLAADDNIYVQYQYLA
jgi:hypothetical protein